MNYNILYFLYHTFYIYIFTNCQNTLSFNIFIYNFPKCYITILVTFQSDYYCIYSILFLIKYLYALYILILLNSADLMNILHIQILVITHNT